MAAAEEGDAVAIVFTCSKTSIRYEPRLNTGWASALHVRKGGDVAKFWLDPWLRRKGSLCRMVPCSEASGMSISVRQAQATKVSFDADNLWVLLADGRQLSVPLPTVSLPNGKAPSLGSRRSGRG